VAKPEALEVQLQVVKEGEVHEQFQAVVFVLTKVLVLVQVVIYNKQVQVVMVALKVLVQEVAVRLEQMELQMVLLVHQVLQVQH
jgi:hypothetical protein